MRLFQLSDNQLIIDPDVLAIPEFKAIWKADKSKTKDGAYKALSYIYYMTDYNSPYSMIPEYKREEVVKGDFIKDEKWVVTDQIKEAIEKYKMLSETPAIRLVLQTRKMLERLGAYIGETNVDTKTVKTIIATVDKVSAVLGAYSKIEDMAKKEQQSGTRSRGDKDIGIYER